MDLKRFAEIYVSTETTKTDRECEYGTGYLLDNGLVITSAHVLTNAHTKIEVKFRNSLVNSGLTDADLAWDGRPSSLDVALVRCRAPDDLRSSVQALKTDRPGSGQEAHGAGFPQLTSKIRRDAVGARELTSIRGQCGISNTDVSWFPLDCSVQLKVETAWKGISGAPIFIGDRLIGVLTEHDPAYTTARFRVVSISRLLDEAKFCEAIGWFDILGEGRREKLSNDIVKELNGLTTKKESVLNRVVEALLGEVHELIDRSERGMIAWLAEHFVYRRSDDQLGVLVHVYRELRSEGLLDDARAIGRIIDFVLPLEIDRRVLFHVWGQIHQGKAVLVDAAVESRVAVDAVMAGVERQRTAFTGKGPGLRGEALIPCDLPAPASEDVAARALGVLRELCRGYDVYASESTTIEAQIGDWSTRLKGRLKAKRIGAIKNRTPYCILERPKTDVDRAILIEALKVIKANDVDILFIELSVQSEIKDREVFLFDLLNLRFD